MKFWFLIILLISFYLYFPLNRRPSKYYWRTKIDDWIPTVPGFVLPYLFFLLFIPVTIVFLWKSDLAGRYLLAMVLANSSCILFWFLFPNGVKREVLLGKDVFSRTVNWVYSKDGETNGCPSGHVVLSIISAFYLSVTFPQFRIALLSLGAIITFSTVLVKQHYFIDLLVGSGLALLIIMVVGV